MNWHYMKNGAQTGPVGTDELKALLASGAIRPDTLVWREGLAGWGPISAQPEFAGIAAPVTPPPAPGAAASVPPGLFTPTAADVEKNKVFGVLAYIGILWLVPLLAAKDSPFARYHCNQGLVLFLGAIAAWIANWILSIILAFIPVLGWLMILLISLGIGLSILALAIIGIINAANGVCKPLPVIGNRFTLLK
jgi:uncharacterized membrane protein